MLNEKENMIFYHGTKADLQLNDFLYPGYRSNYQDKKSNNIYFSATLDAAIWGAELSNGNDKGRVYKVEPQGPYEDDPNLTDKKFPGNPTKSYRSKFPLKIVGEITDWQGHTEEQLAHMKNNLEALKLRGENVIDD